MSGYSDFVQNRKVRKTCSSCFKLIVWSKNTILNFSQEFEGYFQHLKIQQKNKPKKWQRRYGPATAILVKIEKSAKIAFFFFKLFVFMKEQNFECFRKIIRVFEHFKKSSKKMATPVMSGYSDFGQNWKVHKICCFCFKVIVLMKEHNFEFFRRIGRVFSTFKKSTKKWPRRYGPATAILVKILKSPKIAFFFFKLFVFKREQHFECFRTIARVFSTFQKSTQKMAKPVRSRYSDFGQNWKVTKACLFFLQTDCFLERKGQTDCFDERTQFGMFQKNWKGIFNISKNQPKKWPHW